MSSINLEESRVVGPICPHCEQEIKRLLFREIASSLGKRYLYFCQNCRKMLGVSHRKGFWMG